MRVSRAKRSSRARKLRSFGFSARNQKFYLSDNGFYTECKDGDGGPNDVLARNKRIEYSE